MDRSGLVMQPGSTARDAAPDAAAFRTIAELAGDAAFIIDIDARALRYLSPCAAGILGHDAGVWAAALAGEEQGRPLAALRDALSAADGRSVADLDIARPDGTVATVEVFAQREGALLLGLIRDQSARRAMQAEQKRFASMLNHEFRTPLSTIDGAIQRLEATSAHADDATRQRYRKIGAAVDRLIGMLDDYLSPDRMAAIGKHKPAASVSPRALLQQAAARLAEAGRACDVFADALPDALRCDPAGLALALDVLVDNVLAHTAAEAPVELVGRVVGNGVELVVRDGGPGIDPAEAGRIFERGYRGSNAAGKPGNGLGLYMARSVVEVHGGMLDVVPSPLLGAGFRIWLPMAGSAGKKVAPGDLNSDNRLKTGRGSAATA